MAWRSVFRVLAATLAVCCFRFAGEGRCDEARYVGNAACAGCHAAEYDAYSKHSKKAHSSRSVRLMAKSLTPEELAGCFACHATGYGRPGGFTSLSATPELADAGCEVCHGPGSVHAATGDPAAIKGKLSVADCQGCHNATRVRAFGFKPLLRAGAH
ncbi:cytochrome c family protein [Solidesulfovibrio carbinoliphilus subsp. oakridgensis]|uniref:Cytochrome c family protein n=1 Tax=Solidesulfovibrio carbinoliphilus subsp. oakridgensis TaxID=694327 RepID=G7Q9G9_9BACT|nr:cytochrome c family protein [Solidesulfovibrio carbinoliphilus]EHJ48609.1 cytochrome c family protein [Solidesulfovibrio carbinoliphilus subsp. oakridgensis]